MKYVNLSWKDISFLLLPSRNSPSITVSLSFIDILFLLGLISRNVYEKYNIN